MALPTSESVGTFGWADSASSLSVGTFGWVLPAVGFGAEVIRAVHKVIIEEDEAWLLLELELGLA